MALLILQIFGPLLSALLQGWLESLLKKHEPVSRNRDELLYRCMNDTYWWQFKKRKILRFIAENEHPNHVQRMEFKEVVNG